MDADRPAGPIATEVVAGAAHDLGPARPRAGGRHASLDGLRAVAVVAVVLYHADHTLVPGGFVGVDLFFVLSGYLITTLLVTERDRTERIDVRAFWVRRMRRLWPSAWVVLAAIAVAAPFGVWGDDRQRTVPAELLSAFAHVANWYQIENGGYIGQFSAPSPVRHYWSLAIEEQFYLVWPLLVALVLRLSPARRRVVVPLALVGLGAASLVAGFVTADTPDRAYLGTDVRLVALVVGAALAWLLRSSPLTAPSGRRAQAAGSILGVVGFVGLVVASLTIEPDDSWLPRGGFVLVALGSAALVLGALVPGVLGAALAWRPLVWIGRISFALYLVHWPLLVAIGPGRPLWVRLVVALPVSIVVAELLHRLVERPVMERRVVGTWLFTGFAAMVAVTVAGLVVAVPEGRTGTEQVAETLDAVADPTTAAPTTAAPTAAAPTTDAQPGDGDGSSPGTPSTEVPTTTEACVAPTPTSVAASSTAPATTDGFDPATVEEIDDPAAQQCDGQIDVLVVGDSTGRGAANALSKAADPRLRVWDRTVLGCSFGDEKCPDWRERWTTAVTDIRPDVVLVYAGVVSDFHGVDDEPFLSDEEQAIRVGELGAAAQLLSSTGAQVLFTTVAVPLRPKGLFFCKGEADDSNCDPRWVAGWVASIEEVAAASGAEVVDVAGWLTERGLSTTDRPDGLHLAPSSLVDHGQWLVPQIVAAANAG